MEYWRNGFCTITVPCFLHYFSAPIFQHSSFKNYYNTLAIAFKSPFVIGHRLERDDAVTLCRIWGNGIAAWCAEAAYPYDQEQNGNTDKSCTDKE
jgi:hypothetical protein